VIRPLVLAIVTAAGLWMGAPASASSADAGLLSDPGFESANHPSAEEPWNCTGDTSSVTDGGSVIGSEFTQAVGERDGDSPDVVPPEPVEPPRELLGRPSADGPAGCTQVVPVQPGSAYQLSVRVQGGAVVIGTEYGTVASAGSTRSKLLTTTFTTGPDASTVTISVRGVAGGDPFYAQDAALSGPASAVRPPVQPTGLRTDRQTSRSVRLNWRAAPGATSYRVLCDGAPVATSATTSALITGLALGAQARLAVIALNPAGESVVSAPLTFTPVPAWDTVPDAPAGVTVDWGRTGTAIVQFTAPARVTDGYVLYLDGVRAGWMYESPARLLDLSPARHRIVITALNLAGASAPSAVVSLPAEDEV
jgi:hypothetical protein